MTERNTASVLLELQDQRFVSAADAALIDQQLISTVDALRAACALEWECRAADVRCTVERQHDMARGVQWWRVTAQHAASWAQDLAMALPHGPLCCAESAQKERARN